MFNTTIKADNDKFLEYDYKRYGEIYDIIEKYLIKHKLLLWNCIHYNRLYTVFSDNPLKHSNDLSNEITTVNKYVELKTNIPYKSFTIMVNMKPMINMYIIEKYKDANLFSHINGYKKDQFCIMPEDIELIIIYWKLYRFEDIHDEEEKLYHNLIKEISTKGGNESFESIIKLLSDLPYIYINSLKDIKEDNIINRLQIITDSFEDTENEIINILDKNNISHFNREHDIKLPIDYRLRRKTIYGTINKNGNKTDVALIDIFNSAEYELIPYNYQNGIKEAHNYVKLKFILIDLWINKVRLAIKQITEDSYNKKRNLILNKVKYLRENVEDLNEMKFYGIYEKEEIAIKKLYKESSFYPYIPYQYYSTHGKYRTV